MAATSDHDPAIDDLSRELYWAQERVSRARMDTPEVRDRLLDLSLQLRADEKVIIPQGEGNLASTSRWRRQLKYGMFRVGAAHLVAVRPVARRPRRAHHEPRRAADGRRGRARPSARRDRVHRGTGSIRTRTRLHEGRRPASTDRVRPRRRRDACGRAGARAPCGRPRSRPRPDRRQVVPRIAARAPDGGLAELRHHRIERSEGRRRRRA